jgi:hypothetical protein
MNNFLQYQAINDWRQDYEKMQNTMIYGNSLSFDKLLKRYGRVAREIS